VVGCLFVDSHLLLTEGGPGDIKSWAVSGSFYKQLCKLSWFFMGNVPVSGEGILQRLCIEGLVPSQWV
jgi:hypothetical protein